MDWQNEAQADRRVNNTDMSVTTYILFSWINITNVFHNK